MLMVERTETLGDWIGITTMASPTTKLGAGGPKTPMALGGLEII